MIVTKTERLILRHWRHADREPFARINADARVMEFMPSILIRDQSDAVANLIEAHFRQHGFGLCAVELRSDHTFIGFIGLAVPSSMLTSHLAWRSDGGYRPIAGGGAWQQRALGKWSLMRMNNWGWGLWFRSPFLPM
jgi:RimJ/RimL family protein N-acetyltransferase